MLVTMHLDQRLAAAYRTLVVDAMLGDKFAQQKTLLFQTAGALVIGKQCRHLVAESSEAGRLEAKHRRAARQPRFERGEQIPEQRIGAVEHAPIVERAGAA